MSKVLKSNQVAYELCHEKAVLPKKANPTDAGADLYTVEDVYIAPGETKIVKTGLKMAMPAGKQAEVRPRSGISSSTKLRISNAPGTIDSTYRDEVGVLVENISINYTEIARVLGLDEAYDRLMNSCAPAYPIDKKAPGFVKNANGTYFIPAGSRIAQIVIMSVEDSEIIQSDNIKEYEGDRGGGFGHSGTK